VFVDNLTAELSGSDSPAADAAAHRHDATMLKQAISTMGMMFDDCSQLDFISFVNRRLAQTPQTFWLSDLLGQKQQSLRDNKYYSPYQYFNSDLRCCRFCPMKRQQIV